MQKSDFQQTVAAQDKKHIRRSLPSTFPEATCPHSLSHKTTWHA
jgi:hypothetical protein